MTLFAAVKVAVRVDVLRGQKRCLHKYRVLSYEIPQICKGNQCEGISKGTHDWVTCSFTAIQQYFSHGRMIINYLCSGTVFIVEKGCRIRLSTGLPESELFIGDTVKIQNIGTCVSEKTV